MTLGDGVGMLFKRQISLNLEGVLLPYLLNPFVPQKYPPVLILAYLQCYLSVDVVIEEGVVGLSAGDSPRVTSSLRQ